jgi:hypothetical protein
MARTPSDDTAMRLKMLTGWQRQRVRSLAMAALGRNLLYRRSVGLEVDDVQGTVNVCPNRNDETLPLADCSLRLSDFECRIVERPFTSTTKARNIS